MSIGWQPLREFVEPNPGPSWDDIKKTLGVSELKNIPHNLLSWRIWCMVDVYYLELNN